MHAPDTPKTPASASATGSGHGQRLVASVLHSGLAGVLEAIDHGDAPGGRRRLAAGLQLVEDLRWLLGEHAGHEDEPAVALCDLLTQAMQQVRDHTGAGATNTVRAPRDLQVPIAARRYRLALALVILHLVPKRDAGQVQLDLVVKRVGGNRAVATVSARSEARSLIAKVGDDREDAAFRAAVAAIIHGAVHPVESRGYRFDIPCQVVEAQPAEARRAVAGHRILVASADRPRREWLMQTLGELGVASEGAADGFQVLMLLGTKPFDLLLVDAGLPQLDAGALSELRRGRGTRRERRPLMVVMGGPPDGGEEPVEAGVDARIQVPADEVELLDALGRLQHLLPGLFPEEAASGPRTFDPAALEESMELLGGSGEAADSIRSMADDWEHHIGMQIADLRVSAAAGHQIPAGRLYQVAVGAKSHAAMLGLTAARDQSVRLLELAGRSEPSLAELVPRLEQLEAAGQRGMAGLRAHLAAM